LSGPLSLVTTSQFIVGVDRSFEDSESPSEINTYYKLSSGLTVGDELMKYASIFYQSWFL